MCGSRPSSLMCPRRISACLILVSLSVGTDLSVHTSCADDDEVQRVLPDADITYTGEVGFDPRSSRVKFDMLNRLLPDFKLAYSLRSGTEELHRKMEEHGFTLADFEGEQFVRLRTLKDRLGRLQGGQG